MSNDLDDETLRTLRHRAIDANIPLGRFLLEATDPKTRRKKEAPAGAELPLQPRGSHVSSHA